MGDVKKALACIDWGQVVANGGPPCFHVENERFCLRAERWEGHGTADHAYVSLADLMRVKVTRQVLIVVDQGCVSHAQFNKLGKELVAMGIEALGLHCRRFDSKPVELWNLDSLAPVEMEEIRMLVEKVVR